MIVIDNEMSVYKYMFKYLISNSTNMSNFYPLKTQLQVGENVNYLSLRVNHSTAKLFNLNLHSLEVVSR